MPTNMRIFEELYEFICEGDINSARVTVQRILASSSASLQSDGIVQSGRLQAHPLGFVCQRWSLPANREVRLHLWSRECSTVQVPNWPIHDHVFSFNSLVLHGTLINKIFDSEIDARKPNCGVFTVQYAGSKSVLVPTGELARVRVRDVTCISAGQSYELDCGTLHRSKLVSPSAITILATKTVGGTRTPRVIGDKSIRPVYYDRSGVLDVIDVKQVFAKAARYLSSEETACASGLENADRVEG